MTERKSRAGKDGDAPRRGQRAVRDLVPEVGGAAFRRFGFVQSAVVSRWAEIVGQRYAELSHPESIRFPAGSRKDGVLTVTVAGAHAPVMQHVAPTIIERTNRFFGYQAVGRVVIRQGAAPAPRQAQARPQLRAVSAELGESLRAVADPELRACLSALAGALAGSSGPPRIGDDDRQGSND
jgi:hypothetical protein